MPNPDVSLTSPWGAPGSSEWLGLAAARSDVAPSRGLRGLVRAAPDSTHTHCPRIHCRLVTHRLGRQDESAEAGGGGMRVLQIPAIPLDRMWGHGPVPPLEGALELLHEQAARQHAQRNPWVCTAHTHGHPTTPGALIMGP